MTLNTPRIPYEDVESETIKQEIAQRDFDDPTDRQYVHKLIKIEFLIRRVRDASPPYSKRKLWWGYPWDELDHEKADTIKEEIAPDLDIEAKHDADLSTNDSSRWKQKKKEEEEKQLRTEWQNIATSDT